MVFDCTNLRSGAVLCARCKIAKAIRKIGLRARIGATYGRSVRAGGVPFVAFVGDGSPPSSGRFFMLSGYFLNVRSSEIASK